MLPGILLGAAGVIAVLMLTQIGRAVGRQDRHLVGSAVVGLAVAGAIVIVAIGSASGVGGFTSDHTLGGVAVTELARISAGMDAPAVPASQSGKIPSVPSLIAGLEQRLQSDPADASGWALLAQSYAFIGRSEEAELALVRAVKLGQEESDLRTRVASAERNPHAGVPGAPPLN